ncbi:hypothetical protein J3E68DRAFT_443175 [Trichoderma sp. SZMC 28012]
MLPSTLGSIVLLLGAALPVFAQNRKLWWEECDPPRENTECAMHSDILDYNRNFGMFTKVAVMRVRSKLKKPKAAVFLPSGPRRSGINLLKQYLDDPSHHVHELLEKYDLIGMDPRGSGQSPPIKCNATLWNRRAPSMVKDEVEFVEMYYHWMEVGEACKKMTGRLFDNMDTRSIALDMDSIRYNMWFNIEQEIHLIGHSYGSRIGITNLERALPYAGRIVLDGIIDHTHDPMAVMQAESASFEMTLRHFFKWCQEDASCALHDQNDVEDFFKQLTDKFEAAPIPAPKCKQTGEGACRSDVSLEEMMTALQRDLGPGQPGWGSLATNLLAASKGDASAFSMPWFTNDTDPSGTWATLATGCLDWQHADDYLELQAAQRTLRILSPLTRGYSQSYSFFSRCISWPLPKEGVLFKNQPIIPDYITKLHPVLMISSFLDPITSAQNAINLRSIMPKATLVFKNWTGHITYDTPGELARMVNNYILTGEMPDDGTVYQS